MIGRASRRFVWGCLALALTASACGALPERGGFGGGPIEHPTGSGELILRVETGGGLLAPEASFAQLPEFSLLGDGRVVTLGPQIEIYPGPALPNLLVRTITEGGVQGILEAARRTGLLELTGHLDYPFVADAPTTTFTLVAEGQRHIVSAYALGFESEEGGPGEPSPEADRAAAGPSAPADVREARRALKQFRDRLFDLQSWLPAGSVGDEETFEFDELRILVAPATRPVDPALTQEPIAWPLDEPLGEFGEPVPGVGDRRCGTVEGQELAELLPLLQRANQLTPWTDGGGVFNLVLRPLLPDESRCPDGPAA